MTNLGKLVKVSLRDIWKDETSEFTPWLAKEENIKDLSKEIGIELEVVSQEEAVGPFRADILCKDTLHNHWVLIENQLEKTDHIHLGQLMTYAAGLEAVTIIWIAERFTEEHRAALDWLNEITEEGINFFGLEIEAWKIDDSRPSPKFNIVCKPNEWSKTVKSTAERAELSDTQKLQFEYWTNLKKYMEGKGSNIRWPKPGAQCWITFSVGKSYFQLVARMNTRTEEIGVYFNVFGPDKKTLYDVIERDYKNHIESLLHHKLDWRELPEAKESHIETSIKANPLDKSDWARQHEWFKKTLEEFYIVFGPLVKKLKIG